MRDESDDNQLMDAMPLEQQIRIGVGEATEPQCSEPQCSEATMSPALGSNSRRISPPHMPNSKIYELKVCELEPRRRRVRAYDAPQVLLQREACGGGPRRPCRSFHVGICVTEASSVQRRGRRYSDCSHWPRWPEQPQHQPEPSGRQEPKGWSS
jgi:hypothetical protein